MKYRGDRKRERSPLNVTLTTVIPELPIKSERLKKPSQDELYAEIDKIDDKVKAIRTDMKKYMNELASQKVGYKDITEIEAVKKLKREKYDEKKILIDRSKIVNKSNKEYKDVIAKLTKKCDKLRNKMKNVMSAEQIKDKLDYLDDEYKNGTLSLAEEKSTIKEMEELKRSLPFAE